MAINEDLGWVPESCSLPTVEQPLRVDEFDQLFRDSVLRFTRRSATNLVLVLGADAESSARELAERETGCCSFFDFQFGSSGSDVAMSINVAESQTDVLDALTERVRAVGRRRR